MKIKREVIDVNAYDFYIKEKKNKLIRNGWLPISYKDEDCGLEKEIGLYKDTNKNIYLISCKMIWYGEDEPLRIEVRNENGAYYTFLREEYNSSSYIKHLHKNILKYINKFNTIAKRKDK